jgi:hypothetical protein
VELSYDAAVRALDLHQGNVTLNYRGVLVREVSVLDAELYRRAANRRRSRRVGPSDEADDSV